MNAVPAGPPILPVGSEPVSLVLPCLNEEASVGTCVEEALEAFDRAGLVGEVVVVDNGSTDLSAQVALDAGARVVHERRRGYGRALRTGIAAARGAIVVMADADTTYDLARIPEIVRLVLDGDADLVLGARLRGVSRRSMPLLHRFVGTPILSFLVARASGGTDVADSQTGFRAFRREALLGLGLTSAGMEFASEMLIRAARAGWRVREIDAQYRARIGASKLDPFGDGWRHLRLITLLAPDLVLIYPGFSALVLGCLLTLLALVSPAGVAVGSLRWQPVFFSTIALVIGAQSLLAGLVMAHRSSITTPAAKRRFAFVGRPAFLRRCVRGGAGAAVSGLILDMVLFGWWITGNPGSARELALASLAQSLLIVGSGVAMFGVVTRLILDRRRSEVGGAMLGLDDLASAAPIRSPHERSAVSA